MIPTPTNDHCTCCEIEGENQACVLHGYGTDWRKANPTPCPECCGGFVRAAPRSTGWFKCEYCHGSGFVAESDEQAPTFEGPAA